jgi:hypothetical protein
LRPPLALAGSPYPVTARATASGCGSGPGPWQQGGRFRKLASSAPGTGPRGNVAASCRRWPVFGFWKRKRGRGRSGRLFAQGGIVRPPALQRAPWRGRSRPSRSPSDAGRCGFCSSWLLSVCPQAPRARLNDSCHLLADQKKCNRKQPGCCHNSRSAANKEVSREATSNRTQPPAATVPG